ncbi:uncharacterized protein LOC107371966 [Tetranychus urticae]|uniref:Uncharacterized protein n=1 Tax=Tetranychus urticae TaxID=32264 RepID=T1K0X3_TETUR|nr:uncharacterized protein LOC107371966 [Tetranychus urticae]XP_015795602.1 uncharacterized protein LOC107371966 [Tetranychus urticae]XP_025015970.1 uncharacterized protein LOC107371966 [Tetranychus urticae]
MGCRLSKSYLTIIESSQNNVMNTQTIELIKDAHELLYFLRDDNHSDYKCIFVFGGYGSNKGEFIFDLLNDDLKRGERVKDQFGWHYVYLDVEELIIKNIKTRVRQLTGSLDQENEESEEMKQNADENTESDTKQIVEDVDSEKKDDQEEPPSVQTEVESINDTSMSLIDLPEEVNNNPSRKSSKELLAEADDGRWEDTGFLKKYFSELANVITNNWVRQLIEKEIVCFDVNDSKSKYIINLVPNRINLFRDCLYLKQGPNFVNFDYEYVAVNLIRADQTRKDLDLILDFHSYEDISDYFVEYFRSINKLIEVKIETKKMEPKLKITRHSTAVKIKNCQQLEELIKNQPKNETIEVDISEFTDILDRKGSLVFLLDNQIDTGREIIAIDSSETDVKAIRNFVHFYCQIKDSLDH